MSMRSNWVVPSKGSFLGDKFGKTERWRIRALIVCAVSGLATGLTAQELHPEGRGQLGEKILHSPSVDAQSKQEPSKQGSSKRKPQNRLSMPITIKFDGVKLADALESVAKQAGLRVAFGGYVSRSSQRVSLDIKQVPAEIAISMILQGTGFQYRASGTDEVVIEPAPARDSSQTITITGTVIDSATRQGIVGATVLVVGTDLSVVTRGNGAFRILNVPVGMKALSIKMLGYHTKTMEARVDSSRSVSIVVRLRQTTTTLSEVVTTATGQQRRVEVGNDIVKIDAAEILARAPARSVSDMLRYAQVPGVQVLTASGDPGAPTRIRMRGIGSIQQSTDPAIIVDGVWVNSDLSSENIENKAVGGRYASSPLDEIDPEVIESIEILRGPSAASLYGQEAANGVIVITTKRGRPGKTSWSYSFSQDWDSQVRNKFGNWVAYGTLIGGSLYEKCNISQHYNLICTQDSVVDLHTFGSLLDETGPASNTKHNIAVRGGVGTITYSFSASHMDQLGTGRTVPANLVKLRKLHVPYDKELVYPTGQKVLYLNSSFAFAPNKNLSFDLSVNTSDTKLRQNNVQVGGSADFTGRADTITLLTSGATAADIRRGGSNTMSIQSALRARYIPESWWNASGQIGIDKGDREDYVKVESRSCPYGACQPRTATDGLQRARQSTNVVTGRLSASGVLPTSFDKFLSIRPSIGLDFKRNIRQQLSLRLSKAPFGADGATGAGFGAILTNDVVTAGYYVNAGLRVFNRMNFDLGWRSDAGSVIRNKMAFPFPKLATSWLVSDEGFFPQNPIVSLFRLRGAVGYAAVHPSAADLYGGYTYGSAVINGQQIVVANLQSIGNNRLVPERTLEFEGGFDMDLFTDRAELVFTMAHKVLRNAIVTRNLPTSAGSGSFSSRRENVARVDNRSIEISINTRIIDNDAMLLAVRTGLSNVNNVIKKVGSRVTTTTNTATDRIVEGYQIGSVWERPILGYGDADHNGYLDKNEILLGDTTVYMGWNTPKFSASYGGTLSIFRRTLTLSVSLSQSGPRIQRKEYYDNYGEVVIGAPLERQALSKINEVTGGTNMRVSEIRLASGSISYNLPAVFTRSLNAKLISLSLQGSNLALWTNYSGRDPMVNSTPIGNDISDDGFTLPLPRRYALNIRVEL